MNDQPLYPMDVLNDEPAQQVVGDSDNEQDGLYGANQPASPSQREDGEEGEEELEENAGSEEGENEMEEGEQEMVGEQGEEEVTEQVDEEGEAEQQEMSQQSDNEQSGQPSNQQDESDSKSEEDDLFGRKSPNQLMPPPNQIPKRRGRPSKKQIAEREGKLAEYEASEKSSKKKSVRWQDEYRSKGGMDDELGDKMDDEDENFKDGQELKDDGAPRANAVGYDEYLSKIGVDQAERDEEVTGSIKSFCQKRRRVVYESITNSKNPVEEEEERFSAHIEAFGHKMRAKVETVS